MSAEIEQTIIGLYAIAQKHTEHILFQKVMPNRELLPEVLSFLKPIVSNHDRLFLIELRSVFDKKEIFFEEYFLREIEQNPINRM
jgi:hypothetical protein